MTVNSGSRKPANKPETGKSSWDEQNSNGQPTEQYTAGVQNTDGLLGLFGVTAMTADNRNLFEVQEVIKKLKEHYEQLGSSTTPEAQRRILPQVDLMTAGISNILPGLVLYKMINNVMWVMGVLFSNKDLCISSEPVRMAQGYAGMPQQISVPLTPTSYADNFVITNLRNHFGKVAEAEGSKNVAIINMVVVDLEMMNHPEAGEAKDRPQRISQYLANQWEGACLVKVTEEVTAAGIDLPSPFANPKAPYGKDGFAEARVNAIQERVNKAGYLSAANMEVVAATVNNINNPGSVQANSKEIARVTAIVELSGVTYAAHQQNMVAARGLQQSEVLHQFMGLNGGVYQAGYRPLHPVITMETAIAGENMNFNQGLYPFFYGMYLLMATNANYVFTEALRKLSVGVRGNLSHLEGRIDQLLAGANVPGRLILTEKNITDTDFVNQWIRQNVAQHATFRSNLVTNGPDAPINNFLFRLSSANRQKEVKTVLSVLNGLSNGKAAEIVERNMRTNTGWTPDKPVLHRTPMLVVNGLAELNGKKHNTQEVDEMFLGHVKGKGGAQASLNYLGIQYGSTGEEFKARCQKLRMELNQSIYDGAVHINTFAQSCVWDPGFMAVIGEAMDSLGTLNVAATQGTFRPNQAVYAPGLGLATYTTVGTSNANNPSAMMAFGGAFSFN